MLTPMSKVLDAFWRAVGYCLLPRVIFLSLLPVLLLGGLSFLLAWYFWEPAVDAVRHVLDNVAFLAPVSDWLNRLSGGAFRSVIGPLVVVALSVPVLIVLSLLMVSAFMGSTIVGIVSRRRFEHLSRRHGGRWWEAIWWSLGSTVLALVVLVVSLPLWAIPPLALLVPPLVWGWLTYRVMVYDALSDHASADERRELLRRHRTPLLIIGVVTGYLGAAPSLVWALGALALPMMPILIPAFVWLYTLVFVLASLWFTHYGLAALDEMRRARGIDVPPPGGRAIASPPLPATQAATPSLPAAAAPPAIPGPPPAQPPSTST